MDLVVRTMSEVKAREAEYACVKDIASRIAALSPTFTLAKRERRLLFQGLLDEQCSDLSSEAHPTGSASAQLLSKTDRLAAAVNDWDRHRGRSGSEDSRSSNWTVDSHLSHNKCARSRNRHRETSIDMCMQHGQSSTSAGSGPLQVFVFTDLVVFATPTSDGLLPGSEPSVKDWALKDIGQVVDISENQESDAPSESPICHSYPSHMG
jgi:hypothetical protein